MFAATQVVFEDNAMPVATQAAERNTVWPEHERHDVAEAIVSASDQKCCRTC